MKDTVTLTPLPLPPHSVPVKPCVNVPPKVGKTPEVENVTTPELSGSNKLVILNAIPVAGE